MSHADWLRAMVDESFYKCLKHSPATPCSTWILNIFTSFLWSLRVQTIENCCLFVKLTFLFCPSERLQSVDVWSVIQDPYFQRVLTTIIPFFFHLQLTEQVFAISIFYLSSVSSNYDTGRIYRKKAEWPLCLVVTFLFFLLVRLWSLYTFSSLVCYKGHNYPVWDVQFWWVI